MESSSAGRRKSEGCSGPFDVMLGRASKGRHARLTGVVVSSLPSDFQFCDSALVGGPERGLVACIGGFASVAGGARGGTDKPESAAV